jgi:GNAT superfamily N-acetyltransferase
LPPGDGAVVQGTPQALLCHGFGDRALFHAILAERDGTVLGMALYLPEFSTLRGSPGVLVQDLFVTPDARGLGLGPRLLSQVMTAQDWGATYLTLMVDRANTSARRFYERQGFQPRGDYDILVLEGAPLAALPA